MKDNKLNKKVWNNISNNFIRKEITPKINLEDHPDGDKKIIKLNKITPNPINEIMYPNDEIKMAARELAYGVDGQGTEDSCMVTRLKKNLIVNREPIQICCLTGKIFSGHTRYYAALITGAEYVYIVFADEVYSKDIPQSIMLDILHQYNLYKRAELSFKQQVYKTRVQIKVIQKEAMFNFDINPLTETATVWKKLYKDKLTKLQNAFLNKEHKNLKHIKNIIKIIYHNDCERIVKEIDEGKLAISSAIKEMNVSNKKPYIINPNRFNFLNHFDKNEINFLRKFKNYFSQARHNYFNNNLIKTETSGEINIVTDEKMGNENPKKTGVLSDIIMSVGAVVYNELGLKTLTAGTATNSADIQYPELTKLARKLNKDYSSEEIEVKAAVEKKENAIFYGGPDMKKHIKEYLIGVFNKNHTKVFMFLTTINGPLCVKSTTKDKTTMDFKTILKYHKDDIRPIYGSLDNNNEIIMEDIRREVK